jgi:hypothetical protein
LFRRNHFDRAVCQLCATCAELGASWTRIIRGPDKMRFREYIMGKTAARTVRFSEKVTVDKKGKTLTVGETTDTVSVPTELFTGTERRRAKQFMHTTFCILQRRRLARARERESQLAKEAVVEHLSLRHRAEQYLLTEKKKAEEKKAVAYARRLIVGGKGTHLVTRMRARALWEQYHDEDGYLSHMSFNQSQDIKKLIHVSPRNERRIAKLGPYLTEGPRLTPHVPALGRVRPLVSLPSPRPQPSRKRVCALCGRGPRGCYCVGKLWEFHSSGCTCTGCMYG